MIEGGGDVVTRRIHLESVGSTNDQALDRVASGECAPFWVTAGVQTAGRGRSGRHWVSPRGNLYASLAWPADKPQSELATASFAIAVAVHEAIKLALDTVDLGGALTLKWPNDVLCDGRKIAGILLQTATSATGSVVIAGCGINCAWSPDDAERPSVSLAGLGCNPGEEPLFSTLDRAATTWLRRWTDAGIAGVRQEWLLRAHPPGTPLLIRLPRENVRAVFEDLTGTGSLIARLADGSRREVAAGDVFVDAGPDNRRDAARKERQ